MQIIGAYEDVVYEILSAKTEKKRAGIVYEVIDQGYTNGYRDGYRRAIADFERNPAEAICRANSYPDSPEFYFFFADAANAPEGLSYPEEYADDDPFKYDF